MGFTPTEYAPGSPHIVEDLSGAEWVPLFHHDCSFSPAIFVQVMLNMIRNPNLNSSWLFRADILLEEDGEAIGAPKAGGVQPRYVHFQDFHLDKCLVRKLIPRNALRDNPLDQTCLVYHGGQPGVAEKTMVVYNPHYSSESEVPFYHPRVRGLIFLHEWDANAGSGVVSIHYCFFDEKVREQKLIRTAINLLMVLHKHGQGSDAGYVKRVNHDTIIPQATVQNTFARLKQKYARKIIHSWAEQTDPSKHVFEDLGIAAFLIELWREMYHEKPFPGFVDIGCGNGLLVHLLRQEGYAGWGFDARTRKSWENYNSDADATSSLAGHPSLRQHVLLPSVATSGEEPQAGGEGTESLIHDGVFPQGTFIISNHADELTPWTPLLATASDCPFIMIPCCSHALSGAKFRAPAPKKQDKSVSAYSSLVSWVSQIAADCGWEVEMEMLRIPSTRNTGLLGRRRTKDFSSINLEDIMARYGGTAGYAENVMKLVKQTPRGH
ncbi:hypothetical protein JX265_008282 [Neoarthrinium moseri]|uniref:tRNA (uracil-O(2)-)-methyltransferase n=1 Tax=Neoarthrinium moseri TaxID=1658444 RepID=A0A9Q0AMV3_9PEZI|nr:hypothetical protein JX266_002765 [Neoarthrinium moseri]KAI1865235.1 hypothetical protein JX265_008282 [Neoarthrinium moseri]